jgi:gliding motility-associated lipoprotein GldD
MSKSFKVAGIVLSVFFLTSCGNTEVYSPKPKGFNRLVLPSHEYQTIKAKHPFSFEFSKHAVLENDTHTLAEPDWVVVHYPDLDTRIQFTYKPLNGDLTKLSKHIDDAYKLAAKHQVKADSQTESVINLKSGKKAVIIEIEGEVPSHFQFYMTDTSRHYLRGVLYIMEPTLNDSLMPLVEYMKVDCMHILETLNWAK